MRKKEAGSSVKSYFLAQNNDSNELSGQS